jgi:hypothetical protein
MWPSHSSSSLVILGFRMRGLSSFAFEKLHRDHLRLNPAENVRTVSRVNSLRKWDRRIVLTSDSEQFRQPFEGTDMVGADEKIEIMTSTKQCMDGRLIVRNSSSAEK